MTFIAQVYFLIFWIPAVTSAVLLGSALSSRGIGRPLPLIVWFAVALLLQFFGARFSAGWAIGLTLQAILAVYLGVRSKLDL